MYRIHMDSTGRGGRHESAVPGIDAGMADMRRARVEEDEIPALEVTPLPDTSVVAMAPECELHRGGVRKIGAVIEERPAGEAGAVESPGTGAAVQIGDSYLFQASVLDMETLSSYVLECVRGRCAGG